MWIWWTSAGRSSYSTRRKTSPSASGPRPSGGGWRGGGRRERERLLEEVQARSAELERLQQQRARHVLGISHGLRTPLTVILARAQLLDRVYHRTGADGRAHRSAEAIVTSAQRMSV